MADDPRNTPGKWLELLGNALDRRAQRTRKLECYYDGDHPMPEHVRKVKLETEYRVLMRQAVSNWPRLVVDAVAERTEAQGIRFGDEPADKEAWAIWQANNLDAEAGLVHTAALTSGRAFCIVWGDGNDGALITPEHASTTIVAYADGTRRRRAAALRRWFGDDGRWYATLYLPDGLYKFVGEKSDVPSGSWQPRMVPGEEWPLPNPLGVVPVVEFAVNRSLRPDRFGTARGEFETVLPIVERINTTVFAGLLAQTYASFPVRVLIGDEIKRDDDGNAIEPFKIAVNRLLQVENPDGKVQQLPESDLSNYIKYAEAHIKHLAAITKTPPHYLLGEMVNVSADAIRAAEAGLVSKIRGHHRDFGESWEEVMRLAFGVIDTGDSRFKRTDAEILWRNPETRSEAELADAVLKLKDILPWSALVERLGYTPQQIAKMRSERASDTLTDLFGQTASTPPTPVG